jgi:hypothetical protein
MRPEDQYVVSFSEIGRSDGSIVGAPRSLGRGRYGTQSSLPPLVHYVVAEVDNPLWGPPYAALRQEQPYPCPSRCSAAAPALPLLRGAGTDQRNKHAPNVLVTCHVPGLYCFARDPARLPPTPSLSVAAGKLTLVNGENGQLMDYFDPV